MIARAPRKSGWKSDTPRRIALDRRHEHRARRRRARPVIRVVIAGAEEQQEVDLGGGTADARQQVAADRPFALEPVELVLPRVGVVEDALGVAGKSWELPLARDAEALDRDAMDGISTGGKSSRQRQIVARAGVSTRISAWRDSRSAM